MPKNGFKGNLVALKAKRAAQNLRTFHSIQERRAAHNKAHRLPEGTTNKMSRNFTSAPTGK